MKHFKLIIPSAFLLLVALGCTNTNESQQAAVKEPYIKPDSAFVSQSQAFAEEHKWVSFTPSAAPDIIPVSGTTSIASTTSLSKTNNSISTQF